MININLKFPTHFINLVTYPKDNLRYSTNNNGTEILFVSLLEASDYRCMYCGESLMKGDSHKLSYKFEKEHTIEKKQYNSSTNLIQELEFLKECKYNFSVTCDECNSVKRIKQSYIDEVYQDTNFYKDYCSKTNCESLCDFYKNCRDNYVAKNNFIMQPSGVKWYSDPEYLYPRTFMRIIYNLEKRQFSYDDNDDIPQSVKDRISFHISKFKLNTRNLDILTTTIDHLYDRITANADISYFYKFKNSKGKHIHANIIDEKFLNYIRTLNPVQIKMLVTLLYKRQMLLQS